MRRSVQFALGRSITDMDDPSIQDRTAKSIGPLRPAARETGAHSRVACRGCHAHAIARKWTICRHTRTDAAVARVAQFACARRAIRSNTGCGSPGEADITFSTSMVAA